MIAVRLFTSSSDWLKTWLLATVLVFVGLATFELYLRNLGHLPSVTDSKDLWSWHRTRVYGGDPRPIVLLGASRSLLGISTGTLRKRYPDREIVQLGINGKYPAATLLDLADDPDFRGITLVSLMAQSLEPVYRDMQKPYVEYHHTDSTFNQRFNAAIAARLAQHLAVLHPLMSPISLMKDALRGKQIPAPIHTRMLVDRSILGDFRLTDTTRLSNHFVSDKRKNYQEQPPSSPELLAREIETLAIAVSKIRARGGEVILLRMPTSRGHWDLDQQFYQKEKYWDLLSARVGSPSVHFKDVPGLDQYALPDTSHLDFRDTAAFTNQLFTFLEAKAPILINEK
jgi:hypothetical protein